MSDDIWKLNEDIYNNEKNKKEAELNHKTTLEDFAKRIQDL